MLYGSLDGRGFEGEWIHAHVWLGPFTVHLKLTLLIYYIPTQNKKLKKKGKICGTYINGTLLNYGKE